MLWEQWPNVAISRSSVGQNVDHILCRSDRERLARSPIGAADFEVLLIRNEAASVDAAFLAGADEELRTPNRTIAIRARYVQQGLAADRA